MAVGWLDVLKISASSSALTSLMGWALTHFFVHRAALTRDARYLALRLAIIMEKFAVDCADVIAANDLHRSSEGRLGEQVLSLPEIAPFPADADWKALEPHLADRAMSVPNRLALADAAIRYWRNVIDDEDAMLTEADLQAGKQGFEAWKLASDLRTRYKIPPTSLTESAHGLVETLEKHAAARASR